MSRHQRQKSLLMPKIGLILEDDGGIQTRKTFALQGDLDHLDGIDEAPTREGK